METLNNNNSVIETIDIQAKQWYDKINGNSYFSANVTINFCKENEKSFYLPFQYGYGEHYLDVAFQKICKEYNIKETNPIWQYCKNNNIILRYNKQTGCKKRDL